jgi:DNA-directed RNA polymerase subunit RPC12/RpoP
MDKSYSLRIPVVEKPVQKRRKRKIVPLPMQMKSSFKYKCYQCSADVYFLPGHELVCSSCSSRIVTKVHLVPFKRKIAAR